MNNFPEFTSSTFNDYMTHMNLIQIRPTISQVGPIRENMAVHYMYDIITATCMHAIRLKVRFLCGL